MRKIKRALISVSNKDNLTDLVRILDKHNVEIVSTGGTAKLIKETIGKVVEVADFTGSPEILGGRVKTLNPKVHGGILAERSNEKQQAELRENAIEEIDLVVVNLYPFEETVSRPHTEKEAIEKIDIGGPTMIRAAAKNFYDVAVLTDAADYADFIAEFEENKGATSLDFRRTLSSKAFSRTRNYDIAISQWFAREDDDYVVLGKLQQRLRYGENPHQQAELYKTANIGVTSARQIQGKELSYNNINDADAAFKIAREIEEPAVAIIKHANPCGVAQAGDINKAYLDALSCDPISSFGGIVALNREIDADTASEIKKMFYEVIIAPSITAEAAAILESKKNMRVLLMDFSADVKARKSKSVLGGLLVQDEDIKTLDVDGLKKVTEKSANKEQVKNMVFAWKVIKHVKSNAVLYALDNKIISIGAGQMSRVDAVRVANMKLEDFKKNNNVNADNLVLASDAFFPFPDGLELAIEAGASAVIQPGGSVKDDLVIEAANKGGISMYFTGFRHFNH